MLESALGASFCIALAMLDNFTYPADIFPSSRFYEQDLSQPAVELHHTSSGVPSVRAFSDLPEPAPERLRKLTLQHAVVSRV